jgi:nucleotide-binding universal stress UspA family protein
MKNILIPTDFSDTSINACKYALSFAEALQIKKIVLFNAFQSPVSVDPNLPVLQLVDIENMRNLAEQSLEKLKFKLLPFCSADINFELACSFTTLNNGIDEMIEKHKPSYIIMGITGGSLIEEVLVGSNTVNVAKNSKIPVLIIPPHSVFNKLKRIVLAADFKKVVETTPTNEIKEIVQSTNSKLYVINIDHQKEISNEAAFESLMLDTLLYELKPEYHFIDNTDFVEGMNQFVLDHQIDLIISIPKKHGLFESLFKRSHTKKMAFHSFVPLICIHED